MKLVIQNLKQPMVLSVWKVLSLSVLYGLIFVQCTTKKELPLISMEVLSSDDEDVREYLFTDIEWREIPTDNKYGKIYVSKDNKYLKKIVRVHNINGNWMPVETNVPTSNITSSAEAISIVKEALISERMGKIGVSPKVFKHEFIDDKGDIGNDRLYEIIMENKGFNLLKQCKKNKDYIKYMNWEQIRTKIYRMIDNGVFHNDFHPGNYLLSDDSEFFIIDFGIIEQLDATKEDEKIDRADYLYGQLCEGLGRCLEQHQIICESN